MLPCHITLSNSFERFIFLTMKTRVTMINCHQQFIQYPVFLDCSKRRNQLYFNFDLSWSHGLNKGLMSFWIPPFQRNFWLVKAKSSEIFGKWIFIKLADKVTFARFIQDEKSSNLLLVCKPSEKTTYFAHTTTYKIF